MSNLPYDAQIEYLKSTGTQIINTGVSGGTNAEYGLRLMIWGQGAEWNHICGSVRNVIGAPKIQRYGDTANWSAEWYNGSSINNVVILTQDDNIHTIEYKGGKVYVDAVEKCSPGTMGFGSLDFCIFNYLAENLVGSNIQLYSAWVKLDGLLVRDFTPVRVGNVGYLYDKVSETLFGNAGTDSFVLGGDRVLPNPFGFRRRQMIAGSGSEDVLPEGYTRLGELSLTSGSKYIQLGFTQEAGAVYKIEAVIKYFSVPSNKRYLCGFENDPWWGCDKGYFKGSNIVQFSPPSETKVLANIWYDVSFSGRATLTQNYQYTLFRLGGPNGHSYQTYMSFKGVCNIYKNDVLIRYLIPCTDTNNREGMYDIISTTFYELKS